MVAQSSVGFFGKLPCNGDFIERRVPQAFIEVWDPWLQQCVHASRQSLQEAWLPSYLTSPLWRFVLSESVCGSGAYAGLLAPSVDRVGRYFPLTIVTQIDVAVCPLQFATHRASWFDALESLVIGALEDSNLNLEWFDAQVEGFAPLLDHDSVDDDRMLVEMFDGSRFPAQGDSWRAPLRSAGQLERAINAFAYQQLAAQLRPLGVWWTHGSRAAAPSWLSLRGLPSPQQFGAMLDGQWARDGWNSLGELRAESAPAAPLPALETVVDAESAPAALGAPRVTLPDVQLSAIETNKAAFIVRPEIGLWAVAATGADDNPEAVRMIADALQQLLPAPSLTSLVEAVRQTMADVHRRLRHLATARRAAGRISCQPGGDAGGGCRMRVSDRRARAEAAESVPAMSTPLPSRTMPATAIRWIPVRSWICSPRILPSDDGIGAAGFVDLRVHYDRLQREDLWLLCAQAAFSPRNLEYVIGAAASGLPISARVVAEMIGQGGPAGAVVPLFTLEM